MYNVQSEELEVRGGVCGEHVYRFANTVGVRNGVKPRGNRVRGGEDWSGGGVEGAGLEQ